METVFECFDAGKKLNHSQNLFQLEGILGSKIFGTQGFESKI